MHDKCFLENLKNMYGEEEFLDDEPLEILQEFQKGRQNNCHDIQENSQQLVMSSFI